MDKNILVQTWVCIVNLHNGQTLEYQLEAKSMKKAREKLKRDTQVAKVVSVKKFRI